ncbi:type II toxin-antitoxin system HicB family antitoxin [Chromohalobacter sp. 48-RD10]|uniref:type II toxin-antitoxin system HicB family antitoxin n=1 Tax=Chromohalobacter sp. 48-RD10 TaxID=2994063 RepID=UPI002468BB23|nr:type II toxin-antitoxin system HicB family antitoxin [Chromohalobacter sp. 48-RD10]
MLAGFGPRSRSTCSPDWGKSHKVNVTLPDLLIKRIDSAVARHVEFKNRSGFLARAALHELERSAG